LLVATAYNETAEHISRLPSGSEVIISGALYQEKYTDKTTKQIITVDKIRINSFQEIHSAFDDTNSFNFFDIVISYMIIKF
jgi:single-stranded DNA-binding protein